ncbi:MAG: YeeE/YedE family protein [Candidatus Fermentibacteraceae bacterium]|nr:YeeE/YedE family protein [Candidatus Fermentibacteraceae bacterium]MBN2609467.1 YeeE/YedE family protein [Candidatus Fermentibacteraceae bacterium]
MDFLTEVRWSPYVVGAGIGVLSWFTFLLSDKAIGCSTAFSRTSGMLGRLLGGRKRIESNPYYRKFPPIIDWEWMLVLGIFIGAVISALLSGDLDPRWIPPSWEARFGASLLSRLAVAFAGGIFVGFGARWAGGCTSGHGISGTMQLTITSWITAVFIFVGGIAAAMLIFGIPESPGV